jgi:pimeloyl-ACP methyl ester carboxylesterase/cell wall-associated NlpC family hydrolase
MSSIVINGAEIYYQTYGKERPGQPPILLIHGATSTGQGDWGAVAPALARRWRVILPDCRGHGRSSNPQRSYSFKEMASDMSALVRALGYSRAHIIGHSNGGNTALVILIEHPEVVQTAVIQAANAYVSPDLLEREPVALDAERIARESPEWMEEMIAAHGPTHGEDYWRELLAMTLREILSEPNYTPEDLQRVQQPTLVIQGAEDPVNAPAKHAQFIARHIPYAELWLPAGVRHNVQIEALSEWLQRVENFLERRGDDANEALHRLRQDFYADQRAWIFDLRASRENAPKPRIVLSGRTLYSSQRQAAVERLAQLAEEDEAAQTIDADSVQVLLDESAPWALVNRCVTDLRREPRNLSERVSQALLGEAVRILEEKDGWARVRMEHDGYLGWVHLSALYCCDRSQAQAYQAACQSIVQVELLNAVAAPGDSEICGKLPFGVRVQVKDRLSGYAQICLPDGRVWWVEEAGLLPSERWPKPDANGIAFTLKLVQKFIGVPYLWGGRTPYGYDCSGLAGIFWRFLGVNLPRDADQQFRAGSPVEETPAPGDLLFFGERQEDVSDSRYESITHVAISLGGDRMIHANGTAWGVSYNSLDPSSPEYRAWLRDHLMGVRRYL